MKGVINIIFFDKETFKYDWLGVYIDVTNKKEYVIVNDPEELRKLYERYKNDIWVGFNNKHYDQYIFKAILLGMDPKVISDKIIVENMEGWQISSAFNKIPMINYDVMPNPPVGLKTWEGFMGSDIRETSVPFDIQRKLTPMEIEQTIKYCRHDVHQTINGFLEKVDDFNAMWFIVKEFNLPMSCIGDSEARITAKVLGCQKHNYDDEFNIEFLPCLRLKKYKFVQEWFEHAEDDCVREMKQRWSECKPADQWKYDWTDYERCKWYYYSRSLTVDVAGVPHTFGYGGLHGAPEKPIYATGALFHVDVGNYYPSFLIAHGYVTRSATNDNYTVVYNTRKELKRKQRNAVSKEEAKVFKKQQTPYKKMLNALSGAMKDKTNPAYDPRNNNIMCINGQLLMLDLIEHLEVIPEFKLIQSNTDGLIVKIQDSDVAFEMLDDICYEWEQRISTEKCSILLELDSIKEIYQKDVNNYLWIDSEGGVERIGAYLKELSKVDNDLPILNKALVDYMVSGILVEKTIMECDNLIDFQKIVKLSNKYTGVEHECGVPRVITTGVRVKKQHYEYDRREKYSYKCYRVFASKDIKDGRLLKVGGSRGKPEKFANTPDHCFIFNVDVNGLHVRNDLDKQYYITEAHKRLKQFGITV